VVLLIETVLVPVSVIGPANVVRLVPPSVTTLLLSVNALPIAKLLPMLLPSVPAVITTGPFPRALMFPRLVASVTGLALIVVVPP
jgi:hypothetical protein